MSIISIFFRDQRDKIRTFQTAPNPNRETFINLALQAIDGKTPKDLEEYRFVVGVRQIDFSSDETFARTRELLTPNCNIFILMRMLGGGYIDITLLWDVILSELDAILEQATKKMKECVICGGEDPELCIKICCCYLCPEQIRLNFKSNDTAFKCYGPGCGKTVDLGVALNVPSFSAAIKQFTETQELLKHINCQVCRCGRFMVNETKWAHQKCRACERNFCFFCNRDWQEGPMTNRKYYCSDSCDYKTRISFELVALAYNPNIKVPNRRCCPSCFTLGSYDEKCKYHQCRNARCKKSFCFICLKSEDECKRVYHSKYDHKCTEVVLQRMEDFPHLG
jgi:hypothetical protein